ncbi:hypothetical protein AB1Y20_004064 [Prymnesium parvum]|uniref:Uncharacterized protein n=1 Tax=Prymnesium parvum TaxID=97485 RepID=A0AB34J6S8_PRYPA|mmetsp:Transcript_25099/g.53322  ORF Transcript_25099/g.53322 Transcript_25099/m.53322 type:complete len:228 (-) Transcript_25099:358-1041(-)
MAPARTTSEGHGGTTTVAVPAVTYEYLNPNYKESLPREWWQTSFQLLPADEILLKIKNDDPTYTVLDASCRQLQGSRIEIIAECCKGNKSITEVDLRGNGFDADGLYSMVQALKTMPNVKKLNFRGNTCRNEGVDALAEYLKTNNTVTHLNLNENNLGSPGAVSMAAAIKVNTTLQEVDLSLNYIDDAGGKAIADALDANKTLKVLNMSGNEIEDKELRKKCRSRKA